MNQTFQNSAQVLSIGIFFTLMIIGLASTLPETMSAGLQAHGVDPATAHHVATLPPVSILFAAFLGYNPIQHLLGPHVLAGLSAHDQAAVTGSSFFPNLISGPVPGRAPRRLPVRDRRVPDRGRRLAAARRAHGPRRAARARRRTDPPPSAHGRTRGATCRLSGTDSPRSASPTARRRSSSTPSTTSRPLAERGMRWEYPAIEGVEADLLLVTHEHLDHNGVGPIARRAGRHCARPRGAWSRRSARSLAVASEHDDAAGTERGPNTLFAFTLGGRRVAHLGDLGQSDAARGAGAGAGQRRPPLRPRRRRPDHRRRAGRRDRRAPERPRHRADALPHRAHRLPRARRRLRCSARSASSAWSRARSTSTRSPAATPARRRARRALSIAQRRCSGPPSDHRRRGPD